MNVGMQSGQGSAAGEKHGVPPSASAADSASVAKRLQQELAALMMGADPSVSAFPQGDSLFSWTGTIRGAEGTVYEGLTYRLSLSFPADYPFKPPTVRFESGCFHPNVDLHGNICLDILKEKWSAAYSVLTVLQSIQSLLADPNNDSPLNVQAAKMWDADPVQYKQMVLRTYQAPHSAA